jgi:hypothetical protein
MYKDIFFSNPNRLNINVNYEKNNYIYKCHIFVKLMCKKISFLTLTGNILHFRNRSVLEFHSVPSNNYFVGNIIATNRKILNL